MQQESVLVGALGWRGGEPEKLRYDEEVESALKAVRQHLGMEIGFVSEFLGEERVFRHVDTSLAEPPFRAGHRLSMEEGYCRKVVAGELPELIPDTSLVPAALDIPETALLPIGSHMSVPIRLSDGTIYGTFCCFSSWPDISLSVRDLQTMRAVADMVAAQVEAKVTSQKVQESLRSRLAAVLTAGGPHMIYQPIIRLDDMAVVGAEALARFAGSPHQSPDRWFADADAAGMRSELEFAAMRNALRDFFAVSQEDRYLALNISPKIIVGGDLAAVLEGYPLDRIVLELTEHEHVEDYEGLFRALARVRARGVRIAVDDAGSGYASLRHVLSIRPDIIKLDISLTRAIETDPVRQALAAAIVAFGGHVSCRIVAEGIETEAQLTALRALGVEYGQGYLLAKPLPAPELGRATGGG